MPVIDGFAVAAMQAGNDIGIAPSNTRQRTGLVLPVLEFAFFKRTERQAKVIGDPAAEIRIGAKDEHERLRAILLQLLTFAVCKAFRRPPAILAANDLATPQFSPFSQRPRRTDPGSNRGRPDNDTK